MEFEVVSISGSGRGWVDSTTRVNKTEEETAREAKVNTLLAASCTDKPGTCSNIHIVCPAQAYYALQAPTPRSCIFFFRFRSRASTTTHSRLKLTHLFLLKTNIFPIFSGRFNTLVPAYAPARKLNERL